MSTTTYVFMEKHKKYQQFSVEKSALSELWKTSPKFAEKHKKYQQFSVENSALSGL